MLQFLQNSGVALLLAALVAYLCGSVSFAIIVTKLFSKKDIRDFGSGNAGATNVLRSQGKLPAILTTLGDLAKSALAVYLGGLLLNGLQLKPYDGIDLQMLGLVGAYTAGLFCILGHMFPLFFGFRGGKGVMTTLGMMLILDWKVALILLAIFILVVLCTRMVSLGSITAGIGLPIVTFLFRAYVYHQPWPTVWFCTGVITVVSAIVIFRHRSNIKRIINGNENKI